MSEEVASSASVVVTVYQGGFPKYSGSVENANAYATKLRGDALHQGNNLEVAEHKVEIR